MEDNPQYSHLYAFEDTIRRTSKNSADYFKDFVSSTKLTVTPRKIPLYCFLGMTGIFVKHEVFYSDP